MANCKFCGRPVMAAKVFHSACWEHAADKMAERFCDDYCRWPRECENTDSLVELHCMSCPMSRLLDMEV